MRFFYRARKGKPGQNHWSLRRRLYLILIINATIPLTLMGIGSFYSIHSILYDKIDKGIQNNLHQVRLDIEAILGILNNKSFQYTSTGIIGQDFRKIRSGVSQLDEYALVKGMRDDINLLSVTFPATNIGLYFDRTSQEIIFSNIYPSRFDTSKLPLLYQYNEIEIYGPHRTLYEQSDKLVFSTIRPFSNTSDNKFINYRIYLETDFELQTQLLNPLQYGLKAFHVIVDPDNRVVYSNNSELFITGSMYRDILPEKYKIYRDSSQNGWSILAYIDNSGYSEEIVKWRKIGIGSGILSLAISLFFSFRIRNYFYMPLLRIQKGISMVFSNGFNHKLDLTGIIEFDSIILHINKMGIQIKDLFIQVKQEQKDKHEYEIEKLMAQINPHFLYNTLNTAQWLARLNDTKKVDHLLMLLVRVLQYNMAKNGYIVTVKEEVGALTDYIEMQKIRYEYQFIVDVTVDEKAWEVRIPRFLLQPLVENSLYHGIKDTIDGKIQLHIGLERANILRIELKDNGVGMSQAEIEKLLEDKQENAGMGIGLNYVRKIIKRYYDQNSMFDIHSAIGKGTTITLTLYLPTKEE